MPRLYLGRVGQLQLQLSEVLAAVGVPPHGGGRRDGSAGVRVDAPALAPLAVERHLALKHAQKRWSLGATVCVCGCVRKKNSLEVKTADYMRIL